MKKKKSIHSRRLEALQQIAIELLDHSNQHDLLNLIVTKAVGLLNCEAGSLFLRHDANSLIFEVAINQTLKFNFEKKLIPISDQGIAAYTFREGKAVRIRNAYELDAASPFKFNPFFDKATGYKTRSVLSLPLINSKEERLGVLQLINRYTGNKKSISFKREDVKLAQSFAALASSAIENSHLYSNIKGLFEGFVQASVSAIESRDPVTKGHSQRVSQLSVNLGLKLNQFSANQIDEIRVAALLHDFGKIGVKEEVLVKAKKLYPAEQAVIRARLDHFRYATEIKFLRDLLQKLKAESRIPTEMDLAGTEKKIEEMRQSIEGVWTDILDLNEPSILNEDRSKKLVKLQEVMFPHTNGSVKPVLEASEIKTLSIKKGSLTTEERLKIEGHVTQTYFFLKQIPWSNEYVNIPDIAHSHHEKLDGSGYPRGIEGKAISIQARLLTICDIYDALVAADRPYKKALPSERALMILEAEAKEGKLDPQILKVFIEAKVFESVSFDHPAETPKPKAA